MSINAFSSSYRRSRARESSAQERRSEPFWAADKGVQRIDWEDQVAGSGETIPKCAVVHQHRKSLHHLRTS